MRSKSWWTVALMAAVLAAPWAGAQAARKPKGERGGAGNEEFAARRLHQRAVELLEIGETERAVKMLETVIDEYPRSQIRFEALLAVGKHYLKAQQQLKALPYFNRLKALKKPGEDPTGRDREIYLEGLYSIGVAQFQLKNYDAAFPILRKITKDYPNSIWANQAYYYIGLCHFAQGSWKKAIDALTLVGTFVDPDSPGTQYVEAGRRFYVKITDADLPVLYNLGQTARIQLVTAHGDKEVLPLMPLSLRQGIFLCTLPTEIGRAKPGDGVLQVIGGDTVTTTYLDDNTREGAKNQARTAKVRVVSSGTLRFTTGTYESSADAAFLGQPLFMLLHDADKDVSAKPDTVTVKLVSRYRISADEAGEDSVVKEDLTVEEQKEHWKVRDEITVRLSEIRNVSSDPAAGGGDVHTGRFGGAVQVEMLAKDAKADGKDNHFTCRLGDQIVASYTDELHVGGQSPRAVVAHIAVIGEIDSSPKATQSVVPDAVLRARKYLVETRAYLELARIFNSMGLTDGAKAKADEGIHRVEEIIRIDVPIPSRLKEEAFRLKWELYMAQKDYGRAVATCRLFHRLYPQSPFVDQAMLSIGRIRLEAKDYRQAIGVFREILRLKDSQAKAEARYRIAVCLETQALEREAQSGKKNPQAFEAAIREYKACAEKYPDSEYAGPSLAKLVDYYVSTKDYARAGDLLEQVFQDYPDAKFLDQLLLKWAVVSFYRKDYQKAYEKCSQLIFEYPASKHAQTAKEILPKIQAKLKGANHD